ncbi:hypothetical protein AYI70_g9825 [Smittium culicis]|uniref:Uncharacterized protein n=1 Tax=Smittium culicis TaxID=133412 RepID=A0A1R1X9H4_9FUNG|nr:hypothetical protein AYI70_g9825 [Smittium culicis]
MPTDRSLCSRAMWGTRSSPFLGTGTTTEVSRHWSCDVGDGSIITSFHTSDGSLFAHGAFFFRFIIKFLNDIIL